MSLIRVREDDYVTVDYDPSIGRYRVIVCEDCYCQEEYWFDAYIPTGHWIDHGPDIECSACGFTCNDEYYLGEAVACPNCGAHMNGREDVTNIKHG